LRRACTSTNPPIGHGKPAAPICCGRYCAQTFSYSAWKACRRFGNIADDVDLDSDAGVTVALQVALISILAWTLALGIECPFDMRFQGSDNSHARKQHGPAIFGGIHQHLDGKPPFLTVTFGLRKLPDVGGSVSQGLRRRSLRKWDRLSERTIPGHTELPSLIPNGPARKGRARTVNSLGRVPEEPEARGFDAELRC
jgi:hypothetical protein